MSRTLGELPFWDDLEKEHMRWLLDKMLAFSGLDTVTFCIMGNHFHLLLEVPSERASLHSMSDSEFLDRLAILYSDKVVQRVALELECHREAGRDFRAEAVRRPFLDRMHNLSAFMQEFKQRFTSFYNRRHQRQGTIWRDRFKSVLVEDTAEALRSMAAYIDLNPVRAKLVSDPADYRWSGYAEAVAGGARARKGLSALVRAEMGEGENGNSSTTRTWSQIQAIYRCWLYEAGSTVRDEDGKVVKPGLPKDAIEKVLAREGALAYPVLVRCRIRHFSQGVAIGSQAFVETVFKRYRDHFGERRIDGARKIQKVTWGNLRNMRDLRASATPP